MKLTKKDIWFGEKTDYYEGCITLVRLREVVKELKKRSMLCMDNDKKPYAVIDCDEINELFGEVLE